MKQTLLLPFFFWSAILQSQTWTWDSVAYQNGQLKFCKDKYYGIYNFRDSTIQKMHSHGGIIWQLNLPANLAIRSLATSTDASFYAAGNFTGTCSFGNTTITSQGVEDIWLARFTPAGLLIWLKSIGSPERDNCGDICMTGVDLIMTGSLGDTTIFLAQNVFKPKNSDLFVGKISAAGFLQNLKLATAVITPSSTSASVGIECDTDPAGNIYLMAAAGGKSLVDTFQIGSYEDFIMKFNAQLQPQWKYSLGFCNYICPRSYDLHANSLGESYYISSFSYFQSGSDSEYSGIHKLNGLGAHAATYGLPPMLKGTYYGIDLDANNNVYFTGYMRTPNIPYNQPHINYLHHGRLNPALQADWIRLDSSSSLMRCGWAVQALGVNDIYVGGIFSTSLTLATTLTGSVSGSVPRFHARLKGAEIQVGINETKNSAFSLYPNPVSETLFLQGLQPRSVKIMDVSGRTVFSDENCSEEYKINVTSLPPGFYLLRCQSPSQSSISKFLKE